jgi:hypothetical protein
MKNWQVSEKNFKRLEKLRPKGRQKNVVIQYLLQLAKEKGVTAQTVNDEVIGL